MKSTKFYSFLVMTVALLFISEMHTVVIAQSLPGSALSDEGRIFKNFPSEFSDELILSAIEPGHFSNNRTYEITAIIDNRTFVIRVQVNPHNSHEIDSGEMLTEVLDKKGKSVILDRDSFIPLFDTIDEMKMKGDGYVDYTKGITVEYSPLFLIEGDTIISGRQRVSFFILPDKNHSEASIYAIYGVCVAELVKKNDVWQIKNLGCHYPKKLKRKS